MKQYRWVIALSLSTIALMVGGSRLPQMPEVPVWGIVLLVFGIFYAGYSCSRLDQEIGGVHIQFGVRHWKPYFKVLREEKPKQS